MCREQLRSSMLQYVKEIYISHRDQDLNSWTQLIDLFLIYVDQIITQHEEIEKTRIRGEKMLQRDIELLDPDFRQQVKAMLTRLDQLGVKYYIFETLRTKETQKAYYAQGREPLTVTNRLRRLAELQPISEEENKRKITWTLESKHLTGEAIDIVPLSKNKTLWWAAPDIVWESIAKIAKEFGIEAGYYWKQKDYPHFQKAS